MHEGVMIFENIGQKVVRKVKLRDNNNKTLVLGNRSSSYVSEEPAERSLSGQ